jgi:hypothetical protein
MKKVIAVAVLTVFPLTFSMTAFSQQSEATSDPSTQSENASIQDTTANTTQDVVSDKDMPQMEKDISTDKVNAQSKDGDEYSNTQESQASGAAPAKQ